MTRKKLTLMWRRLNSFEFGKDVVLVPKLLGKALDCNVDIVCGYEDSLEEQVRGHETESLKFVRRNLTTSVRQRIPENLRYIRKHAKEIDILMCFHLRPESILNILAYKRRNPDGKVYLKMDTISGREFDFSRCTRIGKSIRSFIYGVILDKIDVISAETSKAMDNILATAPENYYLEKKLVLVPNPFDEDELKRLNITVKSHSEKEDLIITVGRLGTYQKNTEMFLDALEKVGLGDWKCCLIGPAPQSIVERASQIPGVTLVGEINDKKTLWEWYNKAKVFVLTSRFESYGLVLSEAARFGDYIITTDVGAARDILSCTKGEIVESEDAPALSTALKLIVSREKDISDTSTYLNENTVFTISRLLRKQRYKQESNQPDRGTP
ncbi:MAG: glycosyltransferase [Bacteroidales bacterium]|nr:glycosyltransferase [Bacteroidales bacterium]